ncbi:MAG: hypothetical protein AUI16_23090 [Alphaproteobacteria bacterium 13_2_20CM_2_64_7]|jgi:hypothetical protein|nr:MAG: hypothetical protein AUI16_23090 [Alphaproteobacteria bacterium 13_2_20CM_2_64_7]
MTPIGAIEGDALDGRVMFASDGEQQLRTCERGMNGDYPVVRRPGAVFYHGGVAGLAIGDFVLPGGQVGAEGDTWYWGGDPEFCFVTTDIIQAWHIL